jgi:hypothetical protein
VRVDSTVADHEAHMTDDELVAAMSAELEACEQPLEVVVRPSSAFQLVALLQLALRHPGADGATARTGRTFIDHVRAYFTDHQAVAVLDVIQRGDDPQEDRPTLTGRPSDAVKLTQTYREEPNLRVVMARYAQWTPEAWTWEQASLDIGYLCGLLERLDRANATKQ